MATTTYHCPSCSAPISFNPESQRYDCAYCKSSFTQAEMDLFFAREEQRINTKAQKDSQIEQARSKQAADIGEAYVHEYHCDNCGATVITDDTTTSTFCYYCHSPVIISTRLQGGFRPDQILPFKISEAQAREAFLKWARTKKYLPSEFTSEAHLEKMTGMYIPYWFVDASVDVDFSGISRSQKTWMSGHYRHTETTVLRHERKGVFEVTDVNISGFSKIDQNLLNGVEPFDPIDLQPFKLAMLSGFFAEQFTVQRDEAKTVLDEEIDKITNNMLMMSIPAEAAVSVEHRDLKKHDKELLYTLLPVWVLTYQFNHKTYVYSMNGQTGKAFGEMPIVEAKLRADAWKNGIITGLIVAAAVFAALFFLL